MVFIVFLQLTSDNFMESEIQSAARSQKTGVKWKILNYSIKKWLLQVYFLFAGMRRTQPSPYEIPDDSSIIQFSANGRKKQKEVRICSKTAVNTLSSVCLHCEWKIDFTVDASFAQEMRKYLALPIGEKTSHTPRMRAKLKNELVGDPKEEEEEKEKKRTLKQSKSNMTVPEQTSGKRELKVFPMKRGMKGKQGEDHFNKVSF